jgi:transcriptional regulator with XRE-family HTH domain
MKQVYSACTDKSTLNLPTSKFYVYPAGMDTLGKRLKALRKKANMTMDAVGELLRSKDKPDGVPKQTVSAWESDRNQVGSDTLLRLCGIYKVTADYLLTGKDCTFSKETLDFANRFEKLDAEGKKKFERIYRLVRDDEEGDGLDGEPDPLTPRPHPMRRATDQKMPGAGKQNDNNKDA